MGVFALMADLPVAARADLSPRYDVDAFIDSLDAYDIGERTANTTIVPTIGTAATISALVTTGNVKDQFEFTCSDLGGTGAIDPTDCGGAANAAAHFNWNWGAPEIIADFGFPVLVGGFVDIAGSTLFPSDIALNAPGRGHFPVFPIVRPRPQGTDRHDLWYSCDRQFPVTGGFGGP